MEVFLELPNPTTVELPNRTTVELPNPTIVELPNPTTDKSHLNLSACIYSVQKDTKQFETSAHH